MKTLVRWIHSTQDAEKLIAYCARVSSPQNQENENVAGLLKYCAGHGHWSVFEMASMCVEITTSRGIAPQILRHRSFSFQEFSQRYASPTDHVVYPARRQDVKNRQNSHDDLDEESKKWFETVQNATWTYSKSLYDEAISKGIAKECARFLLPAGTETKLYMHGTLRSWIHYIQLRATPSTQKEHREIALEVKDMFCDLYPNIARALEWPK